MALTELTDLKLALERGDYVEVVACVRDCLAATTNRVLSEQSADARMTLVAFESETDNYPVRDVRARWNAKALAAKDLDVQRYVAVMKQCLSSAVDTLQLELG